MLNRIGALKGKPYGIFQRFCRKTSKKLKEEKLWRKTFSKKKSHNAEKTERGTFWFRPVFYSTRKKGETVLVQFSRPNVSI